MDPEEPLFPQLEEDDLLVPTAARPVATPILGLKKDEPLVRALAFLPLKDRVFAFQRQTLTFS